MLDQLATYIAAGRAVHPALDWLVWFIWLTGPGVLFVLAITLAWTGLTALTHATRRIAHRIRTRRTRHHIPPASDNQPGTDPELLWHCRRAWTATTTDTRNRKEKP